MAGLDDLLKALPLDQIAGRLGIDADTAQSAAGGLLPAILGGLKANAEDPSGAASLQKALTQHSPALVEGGINLDDVDVDDGEKIAGHIFGDKKEAVVAKIAESTGQQPNILGKLLPALAPIALSFIAKQMQGKQETTQAAPQAGEQEGGLGGLLGGLLGGGGSGGGVDIGGLLGGLGGLLGGGRR